MFEKESAVLGRWINVRKFPNRIFLTYKYYIFWRQFMCFLNTGTAAEREAVFYLRLRNPKTLNSNIYIYKKWAYLGLFRSWRKLQKERI